MPHHAVYTSSLEHPLPPLLRTSNHHPTPSLHVHHGVAKPQLDKKREESLKRALLDLYRDLTLLKNFAIVNYTAVVKVI